MSFEALLTETVVPAVDKQIKNEAKASNIELVTDGSNRQSASRIEDTIDRVLVPSTMNKLQAAFNLLDEFRHEESFAVVNRHWPYRILNEFLLTVKKLVEDRFGPVIESPVSALDGPSGNTWIDFNESYDLKGKLETQKGFIGSLLVPAWENAIMTIDPGGAIYIKAKVKYGERITAFFAALDHELVSGKTMQGKIVTIDFSRIGLTTSALKVRPKNGIFLEDVTDRIINNLLIPSLGSSKKRTLLFTGDYGTGKTETAIRIGYEAATRFNRTFFYLKNANSLGDLLPYLKNYPHSLVFAEDIDQVTSGERDTLLNDLLNSIDGADLKGVDVVFLLTTNAQDKINPAMRRPGRIDEVVKFDFCSTETISKIYKFHLDGLAHAEDIDWDEAARYTPENLPGATVTEIALRAKEYTKQLHNGIFSTEVLKDAIASMKSHIEFMRAEPTVDNSLNQAVKTVFGAGMAGY